MQQPPLPLQQKVVVESQAPTETILAPLGCEYLLLITPSDEEERQAMAMETWFQACSSDEAFGLELVGNRREQCFILRATSEEQFVLLSKQFSAQYPQAELQRIAPEADPLVLRPGEHAVIGEFALTQKPFLPLKTFAGKTLAEPGADPLSGILAAMEPLGSGQRIILQLALARAPERWVTHYIRKTVEHPLQKERDDRSLKEMPHSTSTEGMKTLALVAALLGALWGYRWYLTHAWFQLILLCVALLLSSIGFLLWRSIYHSQEIYDMKLVAEKLSRAAFYTRLRVIVIGQQATSTQQQLSTHAKRLEVAYRQFTLASANSLALSRMHYLISEHPRASRLLQLKYAFPYWHPLPRFLHSGTLSPDIWNSLELTGAFHLPQAFTDLPLVRRISIKHLLASPEIAYQIEHTPAAIPPALIGHSQHRGYSVPVYFPYEVLFSHKFLIARSRYGKSTLIQLLAQAAMHPTTDGSLQPGLFMIDPHKDLIEDMLLLIPNHRARDVILLDFTDTEHIVALNPLDASMGFTRDQALANLMSSFERIWSDFWGPRMAYFLKAVCRLLYTLNEQKVRNGQADQQYTLLDINPLLQYPDYAMQALSELDMRDVWNQELFAWWVNVYFALPKQSTFRSEIIMPIVSKIGLFQDHQQLRRIVGQPITKAPVHLTITEGKIVLCALSAHDMDDASINVLGSTLINLLHRAFGMQQPVPMHKRRPVFCAADEFQAFSGGDWDRLLSEDTKFGCSMLLATQSLKRLDKIRDGLLDTVFTNCETLCAFNVSATDAKLLQGEFRDVIEQRHIISQPRLHCYTRFSLKGYSQQIMSVVLATPSSWHPTPLHLSQAETIRRINQQQRGSATEIDQQYARHLANFLDVSPYMQKLHRDTRAFQTIKQQRNEANKLEREVHATQQQAFSSDTKQDRTPNEQRPSSSPRDREHLGPPTSINSSLASGIAGGGASPTENTQQGEKRNHQRSKRKKFSKDPVGVAPPPNDEETQQEAQQNPIGPRFPMNFLRGGGQWKNEREFRE